MHKRLGLIIASGMTAAAVPMVAGTAHAATPARAVAVAKASNPTLHYGAHGAAVKKLQDRLRALHYDPGASDGKWGQTTSFAVWAFQKVNHIKPGSTVGTKTWAALAKPHVPGHLVKTKVKSRAEVDIKRQLLYLYKGGKLVLISHISSGSEKRYYSQGHWSKAHTPRGNFKVYRKAKGWETSPLGKLYKANYFKGGYAVHGEPEVPLHPASHGCVRVPMHTSNIVAKLMPIGLKVYVRG